MPAPAVIPAPIAYINAAAVKGFVVAFGDTGESYDKLVLFHRNDHPSLFKGGTGANRMPVRSRMESSEEGDISHATHASWPPVVFTVKKTACSKQPLAACMTKH